jgi:hypothetical protein
MMLFFISGAWGIVAGLFIIKPQIFFIVVFGVINICLGAFCGYKFLTHDNSKSEKRKK